MFQVAEEHPRFLRRQLQDTVAAMLQVTSSALTQQPITQVMSTCADRVV